MNRLTIIVVFALWMALGGCAGSPEARRDKYVSKGKEFFQKKDYARALLEFRNAAKAAPSSAEPYFQIGEAAAASGDLRTAVLGFRKAIELDTKHAGAQLRLAQLMATTDDRTLLEDARGRLKTLLGEAPANSDTLNALALTDLKLGNGGEAVRSLEQALTQSPGALTTSLFLARAKLLQNDPKGAEEVLKQACASDPKSANAQALLAEFYIAQGRMGEAEALLHRAVGLDPKSGPARMDLARLQLTTGRKQEAEQSFKQLSTMEGFKPVYAKFLFQDGRREESVRELERLAAQDPEDRTARTRMLAGYLTLGRVADINRVLNTVLTKNPKDGEALLQRAELLIRTGKYGDAEGDLNEVRRLRPNSPELHYVFAKLHQARKAALTYRQELSETLRLNPALEAVRIELAENLTNNKEPRAALEVLNAAPESQRSSVGSLVQRNWANWTLGNQTEMRKGIDLGLSRQRTPDLLMQDGLWQMKAGKLTPARAAFEEALTLSPGDARPLRFLHDSYRASKEDAAGLKKVEEHAARQPKSAAVQYFLGNLLLTQGDRAGARKTLLAAKAADPRFINADMSLVQLDLLEQKHEDARRKLEAIVAADGGNTTARLWLANTQLMAKNHGASIEQFRKVVDDNPRNTDALNNLAYLLSEHGNRLDEALKYAEKAVELAPEQPDYCDTLGWVLYRKGVYNTAVRYLERADKGKAVSKYRLAMAYAKAGDVKRSRSMLDAALKIDGTVPEAKIAREVVGQAR